MCGSKARDDSLKNKSKTPAGFNDSILIESMNVPWNRMQQPAVESSDMNLPIEVKEASVQRPGGETKPKQDSLAKWKDQQLDNKLSAQYGKAEYHKSKQVRPANYLQKVIASHGGACGVDLHLVNEWLQEDIKAFEHYLCTAHPDDQELENSRFRR